MLHRFVFSGIWSRLKQAQPRCQYSTKSRSLRRRSTWFGIPVTLGVACIGILQLYRVLGREKGERWVSPQPVTWQLAGFLMLPTRPLSRAWGSLMNLRLPIWTRAPLLGLYSRVFHCNLEESDRGDFKDYESFSDLFTRNLKEGTRSFDEKHELVCPCDGKVLHFGKVNEDSELIEQVKGVQYSLLAFLGPGLLERTSNPDPVDSKLPHKGPELYHVVIYLGPGDNHHFYSPTDWSLNIARHIPGELLTVAPWAAKTMPGLFALNERVILAGKWRSGFFSFAAVGAYNVGSIHLSMHKDLRTNRKGGYKFGSFVDKVISHQEEKEVSLQATKGYHLGHFNMGSSIVLVFEGPKDFKFAVKRGESVKIGAPLGRIDQKT